LYSVTLISIKELLKDHEHHTTADKREIKDFPKLPSATSFIRKTLDEIAFKKRANFR